MKNKNLIIGSIGFLLAAVGIYFIVKGGKQDADESIPTPTPNLPILPKYQKYSVETLISNLNVRQTPSTNSSIVGSLAKGSIIFAKPSGTSGWYSYSEDGVKEKGFVSSLYIKPVYFQPL